MTLSLRLSRVREAVLRTLLLTALSAGCATEINDTPGNGHHADGAAADGGMLDGSGGMDGGRFGNADRDAAFANVPDEALVTRDGAPNPDAFFINDPPPPYCGPDGEMQSPEPPGGTPECPGDKNREGCPCTTQGETAACWPGQRLNRNHGICHDGMTTCIDTEEFGLRWGACVGYTLPEEGALTGPNACRCFSAGTWAIDNLSPCILDSASGKYLYSSIPTANGFDCGANVPAPPPLPNGDWSADRLTVDCAGQFELCFAIKAGDINHPSPDDCTITRHCVDVWYPEAGVAQELPNIPAWVSQDTTCAGRFDPEHGVGYAEMSVLGQSIECDAVDDGHGNPYVFHRTNYCPPSCAQTPDTAACRDCRIGASGMFGN